MHRARLLAALLLTAGLTTGLAAHADGNPRVRVETSMGKTHDPVAAEAAWRLSEDFLKRRLQ